MYHALLVSIDGDYVTDFEEDSVDKVWDRISDIGSKWFFYPYIAVVDDNDMVVDQRDFSPLLDASTIPKFVRLIVEREEMGL